MIEKRLPSVIGKKGVIWATLLDISQCYFAFFLTCVVIPQWAWSQNTDYEVTDNPSFETVPWSDLQAGDRVRIHWQANSYRGVRITFNGEAEQPAIISGVEGPNGELPVVSGDVRIHGAWGVIEGVEIAGQAESGAIVQIGASHIVLRNNNIHGRPQDLDLDNDWRALSYDCVKILAGNPVQNEDIRITDNEISYCTGDVIDVTGAKNIVYRNNHLHHFWIMQIKGGTEDILVERNRMHDSRLGITGGGMGCDFGYCGSVVLPTLPIEDRFVARNVNIRNNVIYDVRRWCAIGALGWQKARIYHNTFYDLGSNVWVMVLRKAGSDFLDDLAGEYAANNPSEIDDCSYGKSPCWNISFPAKNVEFKNNIVSRDNRLVFHAEQSDSLGGFSAANNIYFNSTTPGDLRFRIEDAYYDLAAFSAELGYDSASLTGNPGFTDADNADFSLSADSPAIDKGMELGVYEDYTGAFRVQQPDIGAYEYKGASPVEPSEFRVAH